LTLRVNQSAVDSACVLQHINYLLFFVVIGPVELVGNALALSTNPQAFLFIAHSRQTNHSLLTRVNQSACQDGAQRQLSLRSAASSRLD
jgi:hypothetical protein